MKQEFRPDEVLGSLNEFELKHAPTQLFAEGELSLLSQGMRVCVVGSRKASSDGVRRARSVTAALVRHEITVVSGLAEGIETIAHKTAIAKGGRTIAVLGTPISVADPASNLPLLDEIKRSHLAISQFTEGTPAKRENFPRRNRTMVLISDATILIEAGEQSGTRHQGWEALRLGRIVHLLQSVGEDKRLSWPKEMISDAAQVLIREELDGAIMGISPFTAGGNVYL